ncbi:MAG: prenyltransferase/squalene oxidase repeat-containing protein [Planctomycetota bacterium JB042]
MRPRLASLSFLVVAILSPARADEEPLEVRVNRAIDLAVRRLLDEQAEDGSWGKDDKVHPHGRTALSLLALLHAGLPASHPDVARGLEWLRRGLVERRGTREGGALATRSTYETGVTLLLLHALGPRSPLVAEMDPLAEWLALVMNGPAKLWGYPTGDPDLSNTQYALLGLRAASLYDRAPKGAREVWADALAGILRCHNQDGGFCYKPGSRTSSSMTVAGLAMVELCRLELKGSGKAGKDLREARKAVKRAQEWIGRNYTVEANVDGISRSEMNLHYYLYGLERYAVFYGLEEVAGEDWYDDGANFLIRQQADDGGWGRTEQTCFALLFLRKASLTMPAEREGAGGEARREDNPRLEGYGLTPDRSAPCIREWLVAGSFPFDRAADDGLTIDFVKEARVKPRAGGRAGRKRWSAFTSETDLVDLQEAGDGAGVVNAVTYAFTWIESNAPRDVLLWLDADDGVRVLVDGALVHEDHHHDLKTEIRVPLSLPKGRVGLLLKMENADYYCRVMARFTDPEGNAVDGVTWTTRP